MAEGWIFWQPLASEQGWLPQLLLLLVPVSPSSQFIYCYYLPCLLTTTALQNVSATCLYHLPGAVAYASQLFLLPKHASLQTQLWETSLRRAESLWLTPPHVRGAPSPFQGSQHPMNHLQIPENPFHFDLTRMRRDEKGTTGMVLWTVSSIQKEFRLYR